MSNLSDTTANYNIQKPELWTLVIGLTNNALRYIIFSDLVNDSLISGEIEIKVATETEYLKAVQDIIYDNSALLLDYKKVLVCYDSTHFMLFPPEAECDEASATDVLSEFFYPNSTGDFTHCDMPQSNSAIAFDAPSGLLSFLHRTYYNVEIVHRLTPLCEYFASQQGGTSISRMYVYLTNGMMHLCLFKKGKLLMANSFSFKDINEAAYYALHAWESAGFAGLDDEVQLLGDKSLRDAIAPTLRKYISYVMPILFPAAALKIGHDATRSHHDLLLLAISQ